MGHIHSVISRPDSPSPTPIDQEVPTVILVDELPEVPSADTMNSFYVIVNQEERTATVWVTIDDGSTYNWYQFGQKGDTGEQGPAGVDEVSVRVVNTTGTPTAVATLENGLLTIVFNGVKGEKGDQGNSGYQGAAGELEVVNNTRTGGATAALSAEAGKQLQEQLDKFIVISEDDYDDLVENDTVDPHAFYFITEE